MKHHLFVNKNGQIPKAASEAIRNELLLLAGKKVTIYVEKFKKKRSNEQNSFYWSVPVKMISEYTGYTNEEVHELLKSKFLGIKKIKIGGDEIERGNTTTNLTTTEYMAYIEDVQRWASETLNLYIPDPSEIDKEYK